MTKEEKVQANMYEAMEVCCTINCSKCDTHKDYHGVDDYDAAEIAIGEGWYATDRNVYCKNCNEKRLKNNHAIYPKPTIQRRRYRNSKGASKNK